MRRCTGMVLAAVIGVAMAGSGVGHALGDTGGGEGGGAEEVARQVHEAGRYPHRVWVDADGSGSPTPVEPGMGGGSRGESQADTRRDSGGSGGMGDWRMASALSGAALGWLFLVLMIGALVVFALWLLVRVVGGRDAGPVREPSREQVAQAVQAGAEEDGAVGGEVVDASVDPDELARAGRFEQALAVLLVRALRTTGWRDEGEGLSSTAREVVAALERGDPRRSILRDMVRTVEAARFGPMPAAIGDYKAARARFVELTSEGGRD